MSAYTRRCCIGATALVLTCFHTGLSAAEAPGRSANPPGHGPTLGQSPSGEIAAFWRELREWGLEVERTTSVSNVVLIRDAAEFHLDAGTLTLFRVRDRTAAAVFEGSARFRITPPLEVERRQLERYLEAATPEVAVKRLVLLFADSTAGELATAAPGDDAAPSRSAAEAGEDAMELLLGQGEGAVPSRLVRAFLNGEQTDLFWAYMDPDRGDDLYFRFDASTREEVEFGRKASRGRRFEALSSFHRRESYDTDGQLTSPRWPSYPVDAMGYVVEVDFEDLDDMTAMSRVTLLPNVPGGSWVESSLFHELRVDSLRWGSGEPVVYDRAPDDVSALWLRVPDDAMEGMPLDLTVWYQGDIVERTREGFNYLETTSGWLPRFAGSEALYDLTFRTKEDWPVMSVGKRVSREPDPEDDDRVISRWVTRRPSSQVTFSIGDFEEYQFPARSTAPVRIHVAEEFHSRFIQLASEAAYATGGQLNVLTQSDPEEKVRIDIENSLAFFTEAFGPLDFEEYNVAEIPFSHGQAFPGMINLSWHTFRWTTENGLDELFRAHEVAHQWWGIGVRPQTYHDRWLSEGLSEFSALWYMHRVRANPQRYFDRLEDFRESILDRRGESGPIWLGSRLAVGREGGEDYTVAVYSKGAWVLHMLRNLMLDHETGSEEAFGGFMKVLFSHFQHRSISTAEFQGVLEAYVQADMQWFFDQWVYGTDIPTYRFAYTTEELPTGGVKLRVRIQQEDVPDDFMMVVPIQLDFGDEGLAVVPVLVKGGLVETELPLLPREPDAVTFNALESVLAKVHEEGW